MKRAWLCLATLVFAAPAGADETTKVPYRLTDTHHILVRAKINGKGPFNFIVDTGCPVLLLAEPAGKKLGLKPNDQAEATLDRLELEGGLTLTKVPVVVKTPFQIEGMNSLGLAGTELHGLMGYTVLAKYRTQYDFTRSSLNWTPLKYDPPQPLPLGGKVEAGGIDMMVSLVRLLSFVAGIAPKAPQPRGYFGFELAEAEKQVRVAKVLPDSPAEQGGLKAGDGIRQVDGKPVRSAADVLSAASKLTAGRTLRLTVERDGKDHDLRLTAADGF